MEFKDLSSDLGLCCLNEHLSSRSFISGYEATQNDVVVFKALQLNKDITSSHSNVHRWCLHMKTYTPFDLKTLPKSEEVVKVVSSQSAKPNSSKEVVIDMDCAATVQIFFPSLVLFF